MFVVSQLLWELDAEEADDFVAALIGKEFIRRHLVPDSFLSLLAHLVKNLVHRFTLLFLIARSGRYILSNTPHEGVVFLELFGELESLGFDGMKREVFLHLINKFFNQASQHPHISKVIEPIAVVPFVIQNLYCGLEGVMEQESLLSEQKMVFAII